MFLWSGVPMPTRTVKKLVAPLLRFIVISNRYLPKTYTARVSLLFANAPTSAVFPVIATAQPKKFGEMTSAAGAFRI